MVSLPVQHITYAFNYIGAPADGAARAQSLADNGIRLAAAGQIMAAMLPDTPDRVTHAPGGGGEDQ